MSLKFIKNEYPGYCTLITFTQFVKALNIPFHEFIEEIENIPKVPKEVQELWEGIRTGRKEYEDIKRDYFREDDNGHALYDDVDTFLENIYAVQNGMEIKPIIEATRTKKDRVMYDRDKMLMFFEKFCDRCEEVPFIIEFFSFIDKKFVLPDHVYITTMAKGNGGYYWIRAYNSDTDGVVQWYSPDVPCPLIFGEAKDYAKKGEDPIYTDKLPGADPAPKNISWTSVWGDLKGKDRSVVVDKKTNEDRIHKTENFSFRELFPF